MNAINRLLASQKLGRRSLFTGAAATGGLMVGFGRPPKANATVTTATVNIWAVIGSDNSVQIFSAGAEMGQGILSGMAQVLAEELKVDWTKVTTAQPDALPQYDNPVNHSRFTGGSNNIRSWFNPLLKIGATAREMLIAAAAIYLGEPATNLSASMGVVTSSATGRSAPYGVLAPIAADPAQVTPPANAPILSATNGYSLVGQSVIRPDIRMKVNGQAKFGIDVQVPGMAFAAIKNCPIYGGTVATTPAVPTGALAVVNLGTAVAVVSTESTWKAFQLAKSLTVSWTYPSATAKAQDSAAINTLANKMMTSGPVSAAETIGNPTAGMASAAQTFTRTFSLPYTAHATMEVLNCTASVTATSCEVWVPTQSPDACRAVAASITGLPITAVTVHSMFMGGGLGRKGETDYVAQAVQIAKQVGIPVKLTWRREEDFSHDFYRPMMLSKLTVGLDAQGNIVGWNNRLISPSILARVFPAFVINGIDSQSVDGAVQLPYAMGSRYVDYGILNTPVPVGFWRSVGNSLNTFVVESAIDDAAALAGMDPLAYRLKLLGNDPANARLVNVLQTAAAMAGWGTPLPAGSARGIACRYSFGTYVAQIVQVGTLSTGQVVVTRVDCAVDCGLAVNPDSVAAQAQSAINQGLATAMWGKITWSQGQTQQQNFNSFRMMRMADAPVINVQVISNPSAAPGGMGEPCLPPAGPALANAYFALTGKRVTTLPMGIGGPNTGGGD
jgi:isoquinoline 1-oxidoreductase subunit beta